MLPANFPTVDAKELERDLELLMGCLREMLHQAGETEIAQSLGESAPLAIGPLDSDSQIRAASIAFQLLGVAERHAATRQRRKVEREQGLAGLPALWGDALRQLRSAGLEEAEIAARLDRIQVEVVLTAHPTEARRATVLEHHRRLEQLLEMLDDPRRSPSEIAEVRESLKLVLQSPDLLNPAVKVKIPRSKVYRIMAMTTGTVACGYAGTAYWGHLRKQLA